MNLSSIPQKYPLFFIYLFFFYFSGVYQFLILYSDTASGVGLRYALSMSVLWLLPILIWPAKARVITAGLGLGLWAASTVSLSYWLIYHQDFSQSVIFIIFESNFAESSEFVGSYFRWRFLAIIVAYSLVPILLWRLIRVPRLRPSTRLQFAGIFAVLICWPFINETVLKNGGLEEATDDWVKAMETAAPWNLVIGYSKYRMQLSSLRENLALNKNIAPLENLVDDDKDVPKTLVLVIGESTNRQRMGVYGYGRHTTPNLSRMSDELIVFDDVVSPRPYTIEALQQVLSFATQQDLNAYFERPTLLNMMKQAGYDITWITNQQTQTKRNTMLVTLSQLADHQVYLNNNRRQNSFQFDEAVLEPFNRTLASAATKRMIVVHLLGTHRKYSYRYPSTYDVFNNRDGAPAWVSDDILNEYNSYDNAILYNDHVVSALIERLKKAPGKNALIYFSDHGEEVYDTPEELFSGRNESKPSSAMYTVPFILWSSPQYMTEKKSNLLKSFENRPYMLSDFIYTWADVAGITFDGNDLTRSLVSTKFREYPRWIGDPNDPQSFQDYADISRSHPPKDSKSTTKSAAAN